jgi:hypothetical protein
MENPVRTAALMIGSRGALCKPLDRSKRNALVL